MSFNLSILKKELTISKLNLDKCVVVDSNKYNLNTLLLLNIKLK